MTQENSKQPESRRSPGSEQGSASRSAASNPAKPGEAKKRESECMPCEESRSLASSEDGANRDERSESANESDRRTAPGQQGRTGSTYGGETAKNEMEAEGGAEGRRDPRSSDRSGRPERPSR